jgi:prephenate dehydratase
MVWPLPLFQQLLTQITEIFEVVQSGVTEVGVVPFENSSHGPVTFTLEALADRQDRYHNLTVTGEIYLDVHHFLLGRRKGLGTASSDSKGQPLTDLSHITRIYSHPQAFGQTPAFVSTRLPGVETIETSSTSRAAQLAAADESGTSAAIAGEAAGVSTGLDILASHIEDRDDNTTRFLVIIRDDSDSSVLPRRLLIPFADKNGEADKKRAPKPLDKSVFKALLRFTVPHETPGALADVLGSFKRAKLNLTSINSLPSLERPFRYVFFVEFEGDGQERMEEAGRRIQGAYDDIAKVAKSWRKLGIWMKQRE